MISPTSPHTAFDIGVKHKDQNKSTESRRHKAREIQQITLGKVGKWGAVQVVKAFLGMPMIPGR